MISVLVMVMIAVAAVKVAVPAVTVEVPTGAVPVSDAVTQAEPLIVLLIAAIMSVAVTVEPVKLNVSVRLPGRPEKTNLFGLVEYVATTESPQEPRYLASKVTVVAPAVPEHARVIFDARAGVPG